MAEAGGDPQRLQPGWWLDCHAATHSRHLMFDCQVTAEKVAELRADASCVVRIVGPAFPDLNTAATPAPVPVGDTGFVLVVAGAAGTVLTVRGLVGRDRCGVHVDVAYTAAEGSERRSGADTLAMVEGLRCQLVDALGAHGVKAFPPILRGTELDPYVPTRDGMLVQYDFTEVAFAAKSEFQDIKILSSQQFGNVLLLDDDVNLAESDLVYTQTITGSGRYDYAGKTVLILGGGDGGILHHLVGKKPKFVTMIDIDEVVVTASAKHLRGICHDSLDTLQTEQYHVIVGDAVKGLEQFVAEGRTFDFVINDMTATPVSVTDRGSEWDFVRLILSLSMKVLGPGGKYITQGDSANATHSLHLYEQQLAKLQPRVAFSTETVNVPSYQEMWVFYTVWHEPGAGGGAEAGLS